MKHLSYCLTTAALDCGEPRHAQEVMKELGITYFHSVPQSITDSWQFYFCRVPSGVKPLKFLQEFKPHFEAGWGLSEQDVAVLKAHEEKGVPDED